MVLAQSDENIKYLNASLVAKLRDYNIVIPSFTIPDVLTQQGFRNAMKEVPFNDNGWIENTLNCLNIGTASCRGCDTRQTDYGQCSAGCFVANTCGACVGACNSGDAVCISCHSATDDSEVYICESCNTGCEGCNETCYGCNEGCQGAQTCATCNTGLPGAPCEYTAGCENCQGDVTITQPTWGCTDGCNSACVSPDSCGTGQVPKVDGCTSNNEYIENEGCNSTDGPCRWLFDGRCKSGYSGCDKSNGNAASCDNKYSYDETSCAANFDVGRGGLPRGAGSCESGFKDFFSSCSAGYSYGHGVVCVTDYLGSAHCAKGYASGRGMDTTCTSKYEVDYFSEGKRTCQSGYNQSNNDDKSCSQGYSDRNVTCPTGYTSTGTGTTCISHFYDGSTYCASNHGLPTCSSCNAAANDTCLNCVSTQATCTSCVNGEAASCTSCVSEQGCTDCQGCDSGCNADVSCNGYSVGENKTNVCMGQYTDTTCYQTCTGGFDSSSMCLSGQGSCSSCDSGCQGCDDCQGKDTICSSCYNVCNSCQGYTPCTPCVSSFACDPCYGNNSGCSFGTKAGG